MMNSFPGRLDFSLIQRVQRGVAVSLFSVLLSSGGYASPQQGESPALITRSLTAGGSHEECLLVPGGGSFHYDFTASAALEFNVHHHEGGPESVTFLFGPEIVDASPEENVYTVRESKVICLLWSNKQTTPVELNYSLGTLGPDEQGEP